MQMFHVSDIAVARLKAIGAIFVLQLDHDNVAFCKEVLESHNREFTKHGSYNRQPWQLKKSKFWGLFWSYLLNSTANAIQPIYRKNGPKGLNWQCCLAGSSKTAPRILIFSIAMVADYSFDVKNIDIWAPAFFKHNNLFIATV